MAAWKWLVGGPWGGHDYELTAATDRRATFRLRGSHEASCSLDGRHEQAAGVAELATDLHVLRDGQPLFRGRVGALSDSIDASGHRVTVPALDYREVLRRRLLGPDIITEPTLMDQSDLAWSLVGYAQYRTGGDLGISRASTAPTGVGRDGIVFDIGQSVGGQIDELAGLDNGFDWDIVPTSASGLAFTLYHPGRGADRGAILDLGGAVAAVSRQVDTRQFGNALIVSGGEGTAFEQREVAADLNAFGRWDLQTSHPDVLGSQELLAAHADADFAYASSLSPSWSVTLRAGWWQGPDHLWLGDTARLVVMSGRLQVDEQLRVMELSAQVGASGEEVIEVTLGRPRPTFTATWFDYTKVVGTLSRLSGRARSTGATYA